MPEKLTAITEAERETGISKDQLRVWERRYGFPTPSRNTYGERVYSDADIDKLKMVRRLLDAGMRPGKILPLPYEQLCAMTARDPAPARTAPQDLALYLLRTHQTAELRRELDQSLMREGMYRFITDTAAPLAQLVGDAWMRGQLRVFEEHMFTEVLQGLLLGAIARAKGSGGSPRVLLTTLPSEQHALGMLMAEAVLVLEGAECVPLGLQTPGVDVVDAARAKAVDVVALSFSANFPPAQLADALANLRAALPAAVALWCGGAGAARARRVPAGITIFGGLDAIGPAIRAWRTAPRAHAGRE